MQPSPYQAAIYDWITTGRGDAVVNAVAGSGKTTTIVEAAAIAAGRRLFVAFNKAIAEELGRRLPADVESSTIHSAGYRALRAGSRTKYRVEQTKSRDIAQDVLAERYGPVGRGEDEERREERREQEQATTALLDKCRLTLTDAADRNAVADLAWRYGIAATVEVLDSLPVAMTRSNRAAERGLIDFTDMIFLPVVWQMPPQQYDWLFVDEAQDLSPVQLALLLRMRAPGGRMVAVGDRAQAIYGFAGADPRSMDRIIEATGAVEMPLSICYRCPQMHLDLARSIVPHIEARPDAPLGDVATVSEEQLPALVRNGDLIMCRVTAPLIAMCIQLIAARIPARVRGRDVAKQLTAAVQDMARREGFQWAQFGAALDAYRSRQQAKAGRRKDGASYMESVEDRIAGIVAVADGYNCGSADELCRAIESLFADESASVWLSSVHRAKGLEAGRTFILRPEKLPLDRPGMQPWEREQETNLLYVALTRCKASSADAGSGLLTYVVKDMPAQPDVDGITEPSA